MTRRFLKMLLVASVLVPVAAQAQRFGADAQVSGETRGDRGERPDRGQRFQRADPAAGADPAQSFRRDRPAFDRDPGGDRPQRPAFERDGARPDWNSRPRADRQPVDRTQIDRQQSARPESDRQADQVRDAWIRNSADRRGDGRGSERGGFRNDRGPGFDRGPGSDRNPAFDRGPGFGRDGRGDRNDRFDRDDQFGRDGRFARDDQRGRGYQNRQQFGGFANAPGYGRGGYDTRRLDQRGTWNRGWRSDNRYGWSNYRAANRGAYRLPRYYAPSGWGYGYRRFNIGFSLNSILYNQNYWIQDPYTYRLPEAYGPYRWVRYYNDALLVDLDSGRVVDTVYDIFW